MGWENAKELKKKAEEWEKLIKSKPINTNESISQSVIYTPDFNENNTKIRVVQDTSVDAIFKIKTEGKKAVLNFASYKKPGGGYIDGAMAQEESLCHASNLYQVISSDFLKEFYEYNNEHLNKGLYDSRIIYSPNIVFYDQRDKELPFANSKRCDVITCAAPNKNAAQKYQNVPDYIISNAMRDRIASIFKVAAVNNVEVLILGAFGCGVFGNSITDTAKIFNRYLHKYQYYRDVFKLVVFAIPDTSTYNIFKDIIEEN